MTNFRTVISLLSAMSVVSSVIAEQGPLMDAVAAWSMATLKGSAANSPPLATTGKVEVGIELSGAEKEASLARGGDGRVAAFEGGYLDAGPMAANALETQGDAFSLSYVCAILPATGTPRCSARMVATTSSSTTCSPQTSGMAR